MGCKTRLLLRHFCGHLEVVRKEGIGRNDPDLDTNDTQFLDGYRKSLLNDGVDRVSGMLDVPVGELLDTTT